jgi:citrate lyase subunit beta / citryl-CoA lyase
MTRAIDHIRTWLYVPADQPRRLDKAMAAGADAVIVDLEDAVAPANKAAARTSLVTWLTALPSSARSPSLWVRINGSTAAEDLAVACHPQVEGICVPKAESTQAVEAVESLLEDLEAGQPERTTRTRLMLLIETARGVLSCPQLAACGGRLAILQLGELDLRADLRLLPHHLAPPSESGLPPLPGPIQAARNMVVLASAAAGLSSPIAPVSPEIHDHERLTAETGLLRASGFGSRAVIHPAQISAVEAAFAPTDVELEWAIRIVEAHRDAEARGTGVAVVDGRMVDAPVVKQARSLLRRSGRVET